MVFEHYVFFSKTWFAVFDHVTSLQGRLFINNSLFHHCENADKKGPLGVVMMVIMTRLKENYEDWRKKDD